ncbi:MAG: septum formation family protein, partial [Acidimicrobiales bacterium]
AKPCAQPHDGETFAVLTLPGDLQAPFPGEAEAQRLARSACLAGFERYVGREYAVSRLRISLLRPSGSTWAAGDRVVVCTLYDQDLVPLNGPAQGSGL